MSVLIMGMKILTKPHFNLKIYCCLEYDVNFMC